jgi:hypothetical protein
MDQSRTDDIHQVSDVENVFLIEPYTKEEVKKRCFPNETQQCSMTGWFPANLLELFSVLHAGQLDLHLNFGDINFFLAKS